MTSSFLQRVKASGAKRVVLTAAHVDALSNSVPKQSLQKLKSLESFARVKFAEVHDFGAHSIALVSLVPKHTGKLADGPAFNADDLAGMARALNGLECDLSLEKGELHVYLDASTN